MTDNQIKKIVEQLANHEARINVLEGLEVCSSVKTNSGSEKQKTLREIVKGRKFKNGQEQIAVIVGYHEKVLGTLINKESIKLEWINAKMTRKYSAEFVARAKDVFIRINSEEVCDLTQTGEEFFEKFIKNETKDVI